MNHDIIYYATSNSGKFEEVEEFIKVYEPSLIVKQFEVDIDEIQSLDQKLISLDKVQKAWMTLKKPVLIDDGGVYFEHYYNFPGTLTKYVFEGIGYEGVFKLVSDGDPAYFKMHMAYCDGNVTEVFESRIDGTIVKPTDLAKAHYRLPLDIIFKPKGAQATYAEMRGSAEFNERYGYRQQALKKFIEWYKKEKI